MNIENKKQMLLKLLEAKAAFTRFEILEHYADFADAEADIFPLQKVLAQDPDPIVRHEAAAQLLKIETKKPGLTVNLRPQIQAALIKSVCEDNSVIVRHESMEALAYIGDRGAMSVLESLVGHANADINCTAKIACDILRFRLLNKLSGAEISDALMPDPRLRH